MSVLSRIANRLFSQHNPNFNNFKMVKSNSRWNSGGSRGAANNHSVPTENTSNTAVNKGAGKNGSARQNRYDKWLNDRVEKSISKPTFATFAQKAKILPKPKSFTPIYEGPESTPNPFCSVNAGDVSFYMKGSGGINRAFDMAALQTHDTAFYKDFHNCFVESCVKQPDTIYEVSTSSNSATGGKKSTNNNNFSGTKNQLTELLNKSGLVYSCVTVPERAFRVIFEDYSQKDIDEVTPDYFVPVDSQNNTIFL